jgi:hypothetical protein
MYTELSYDVDGHVGVITLRRPRGYILENRCWSPA